MAVFEIEPKFLSREIVSFRDYWSFLKSMFGKNVVVIVFLENQPLP